METDILEMLDDEYKNAIVGEFSSYIQKFSKDPKNAGKVDYSFDVSKGKITSQEANTSLDFDVDKKSLIHSFIKALYGREVNEEDNLKINIFIQSVADTLTDHYSMILRDSIRKAVMPQSDINAFPFYTIKICHIDLVDYSAIDDDDKYLLKIKKLPGVHIDMPAITQMISEKREETGLSSEEIVEQERLKGNKILDGVLAVEKGEKYLWDVRLSLFVDYSASDELVKECIQQSINKVEEQIQNVKNKLRKFKKTNEVTQYSEELKKLEKSKDDQKSQLKQHAEQMKKRKNETKNAN